MSAPLPTQNAGQDLLEILLDNSKLLSNLKQGPKYKRDLAEELEVSTKTVYRRAKQLEQYDLVSRSQNGYQLTKRGNILVDPLFKFQSNINKIAEIINSNLEFSADDLPPSWVLSSASLAIGDEETPCQYFDSLLHSAKKVRGALPPFANETIDILSKISEKQNVKLNLIMSSQSNTSLRAPSLASLIADQNVTIDRTNNTIPYGIFTLYDDQTQVIITFYDEDNIMKAILKSENQGVIGWAENRYEGCS